MKRTIQYLVAVCLCAGTFVATGGEPVPVQQRIRELQSRDEHFSPANLFSTPELRIAAGLGDYTHLTLDEAALKKLFKAKYPSITLRVPLSDDDTISLLLTQQKILTDDFIVSITDAGGERPTRYEPGLYYQGNIEGNENSLVAISIFKDHMGGIISDENGNWNLGQLERTGRAATKSTEYVFFNDRKLPLPISSLCGTTENEVHPAQNEPGGNQRALAGGDCVRLFFDCDYDFYTYKSSNTTAVTDYVTLMFNAQSVLYGNESITVALSGVNVWVTADPFNLGSSNANMYAYSDYRRTNFNGDLAQLLARDAGGLGGIAWINVLCANYSAASHAGPISYCDINASYSAGALAFPTYTWDVSSTAHELGHNLGSRHTHWCGWTGGPIDNCNTCWGNVPFDGSCTSGPNPPATGGTIMSYCHGCAGVGISYLAGFGTQPGNLIRSRVASATCLTECESSSCEETVTVTSPITSGTAQYNASNMIQGSSTIESGAIVSFTAENAVILSVGFNAKTGSNFTGAIGTCMVAATPQMEETAAATDSMISAFKAEEGSGISFTAYPNPFKPPRLRVLRDVPLLAGRLRAVHLPHR